MSKPESTASVRMNREVKAKWLAALRSGDYQQTTDVLRTVEPDGAFSYCCLGVLCDLYRIESGGEWAGNDFVDGAGSINSGGTLTANVRTWAGARVDQIDLSTDDDYDDVLAELNDNDWSFRDIADLIEEQL